MVWPWRELADEDVAGGVEQEQAGYLRGGETVHEHAERIVGLGLVPRCWVVNQMLVLNPVVGDGAGGDQEDVLAHVDRLAGLERQGDQLARGVAREGDVARAPGPGS